MKDVTHHRKYVQKKVLQSIRKEAIQENQKVNHNSSSSPSTTPFGANQTRAVERRSQFY